MVPSQLQTSTEGFVWAVEQIPHERHFLQPRPDRWSVARIIYPMLCYDRLIGFPLLRQWVGEPRPVVGSPEENVARQETRWHDGESHDVQEMLADLTRLRAEYLTLMHHVPEQLWSEERHAIWGSVTLQWVVTKTYQHTLGIPMRSSVPISGGNNPQESGRQTEREVAIQGLCVLKQTKERRQEASSLVG